MGVFKRFSSFFLIIVLTLYIFSSCTKSNDEILIGVNLELTGRLAQYGSNCYAGIKIALDEINSKGGINGKRIKLKLLDNCSQSSLASLNNIKLAKDKAVAIIGPSTSTLVKASLEAKCQIPVIAPSATANILTSDETMKNYIFRVCYTDSLQGSYLAGFANRLGFKNFISIIDNSSDYSQGISKSFEEKLKTYGGSVADKKYYTSTDTDFMAVLSSLKTNNIDALFIPGYYTEAGLIIKQARQLGIKLPILSGDAFDSPALADIVGEKSYLNDVYFTNHFLANESEHRFVTTYEDIYKKEPAAYCALGYDSLMLAAKAIENTKDNEPLIKALKAISDFKGVTGSISIDENGNATKEPVLIKFVDGKPTNGIKGDLK